jgi:hypothetical protein
MARPRRVSLGEPAGCWTKPRIRFIVGARPDHEDRSMIEFHDPRARIETSSTPYDLGIDLERRRGVTVGFLANGFPDSAAFLEALAAAMGQRVVVAARHWNKGNASIPASPEILREIETSCQAVVAAYGH